MAAPVEPPSNGSTAFPTDEEGNYLIPESPEEWKELAAVWTEALTCLDCCGPEALCALQRIQMALAWAAA